MLYSTVKTSHLQEVEQSAKAEEAGRQPWRFPDRSQCIGYREQFRKKRRSCAGQLNIIPISPEHSLYCGCNMVYP